MYHILYFIKIKNQNVKKDGIRILYLFKVGKGKTGLGTQC